VASRNRGGNRRGIAIAIGNGMVVGIGTLSG
jgi:hypothetical protein